MTTSRCLNKVLTTTLCQRCHKKYEEHLELYVKAYLGIPLDKVTLFFEGVQLKLNSGVPYEEIGFYPEFSKQKLKALTGEYTVKEVKKGLESTMKKIEKHFTKEQNLFMVGQSCEPQENVLKSENIACTYVARGQFLILKGPYFTRTRHIKFILFLIFDDFQVTGNVDDNTQLCR